MTFLKLKPMWLLWIIDFMIVVANTSTVPLVPLAARDADLSVTDIGFIGAAFGISRFISGLFLGTLGDYFGHKKFFNISLALLATSLIGFSFSTSFNLFFLSRLLQGVALGGLTVAIQSIIAESFCKEEIKTFYSTATSLQNIGMTAGPAIGGFLVHCLGFKNTFLAIGSWAALMTVCAYLVLGGKSLNGVTGRPSPEKLKFMGSSFFTYPVVFLCMMQIFFYFSLGAWLTGMPIIARDYLHWTSSAIVLTFSAYPLLGILITPLLKKYMRDNYFYLFLFLGLISFPLQIVSLLLVKSYQGYIVASLFAGSFVSLFFCSYRIMASIKLPVQHFGKIIGIISAIAWAAHAAGSSVGAFLYKQHGLIYFSASVLIPIIIGMLCLFVYWFFQNNGFEKITRLRLFLLKNVSDNQKDIA